METQNQPTVEAALVVLVPEVDELIGPFRERFDHSASEGMLAHITINYPFQPNQPDRRLFIKELKELFAGFPSQSFKLTELRQFPDTLYLAVEPEKPFRDMIEAVVDLYPESPPYGGTITVVVPHVTISGLIDGVDFSDIAKEFGEASRGKLPVESTACQVWLMEYKDNFWTKTIAFDLGEALETNGCINEE